MKLHRIVLENLNSLYGEHTVDFEADLDDAPLFLVMGPTGAGKSTLMDAVSLALFGQTPRLGGARAMLEPESGLAEDDARQVMSHGTGHCRAELVFSKRANGSTARYRAIWTCQRARKKPEGRAQAPHRSLERWDAAAGDWELVAGGRKIKEFGGAFNEVLEGFGVDDFKRSMLLAQGEFAAFLRAGESERAAILERLTDTSRYRTIGARAMARWQEAKSAVETQKSLHEAIAVLPDDEREALAARVKTLRAELDRHAQERDAAGHAVRWRERRDELAAAFAQAEETLARAEEAWTREAGGLAALAEHERCSDGAEPLRELRRLRNEEAPLAAQLPTLVEDERQAAAARAVADEAAKAARAEAQRLATTLNEQAPRIREARARRQALAAAEEALQGADARHGAARDERKTRGDQETAARERTEATAAALRAAHGHHDAEAGAAPLVEKLAGLEEERRALAGDADDIRELEIRRKNGRTKLAEQDEKIAKGAVEQADAERRLTPLAKARTAAETALRETLGDAPSPSARRKTLRDRDEQLEGRLRALDDAARLLDELAGTDRDGRTRGDELATVEREHEGLAALLDADARAREALAKEIEDRRALLEDLRWAQGLADERRRLREGEPCPLCGSEAHPFAEDAVRAERDSEVAARCERITAEVREKEVGDRAIDERARGRQNEIAALEERLRGLRKELDRLRAQRRDQAGRCLTALRSAGLDEAADRGTVDRARETVGGERATVATALQQLDDAEQGAGRARQVAEDAEKSARDLRVAVDKDRDRRQTWAEALGEIERDLEVRAKRLAASERALVKRFEGFGVAVPKGADGPQLGVALEDARKRVERFRQVKTDLDRALKDDEIAKATLATAEKRRADADAALATATTERAEAERTRDERRSAAADVLGGADPDALELELNGAVDGARGAQERAERALGQADVALATARKEREAAGRRLRELSATREEAATALAAVLAALALPTEEELAARLLASDRARELTALRKRLDGERDGARRTLAERRQETERHDAARPEGLDPQSPLDDLRARCTALDEAVAERTKRLGGLDEQIRRDQELRERQAESAGELDRAKKDLAVWERLHGLVGTNGGEAFKRFAQILNMEELVGRANAHLKVLAERYRLRTARDEIGHPTLGFVVEDRHQAGERRPLTTLSGGETFLVSLALALGLADFRSVRMPIETLLLDEGFGTLDPETLETAMGALERLHADGTQVGLISHVEGLRERIEARVVVEKIGNGRSRLHVELGSGPAFP